MVKEFEITVESKESIEQVEQEAAELAVKMIAAIGGGNYEQMDEHAYEVKRPSGIGWVKTGVFRAWKKFKRMGNDN